MANVNIPENGSRWLSDASIDRDDYFERIASADLTDNLTDEERSEWDGNIELSTVARLAESIGLDTGEGITRNTQFNVCNDENDFDGLFQATVWTIGDDHGGEWFYADTIWIVSPHCGGDPRGNYGAARAFYIESAAENGALDWVVGWYVERAIRRLDNRNQIAVVGWEPDEETSERTSVGYSSNPTHELSEIFSEEGEWKDGAFYFEADTNVRATPYSYAGEH